MENYIKLVSLRTNLTSSWSQVISRPRDVGCKRASAAGVDPFIAPCSENYKGWFDIITQDPSIQEDGFLDPITALEDMILSDKWVTEGGFCEGCVKIWKESWTADRQKLWRNLDVWLELGLEEFS